MTLAADTWGIPGPTFIVAYLVLIVVAWSATLIVRAALRSGGGGHPHTDRLAGSPTDVAYLNEGPKLAVYAALAWLRAAGMLAPTRFTSWKRPRGQSSAGTRLRATGRRPAADASRMESVVYQAAAGGVEPSAIPKEPAVAAELDGVRARLTAAGLLTRPGWRAGYRLTALGMAAVTVLGLVRLVAGTANGKPVGYLVTLLLMSAVVTMVLLQAPRQTGAGKRVLKQLRKPRQGLSPKMRPDWTAHGPAGAGLSVALFGVGAVWASDPTFAAGLGLANPSASSGRGGGAGGGCGGGGGGGGCGG